MYFAKWKSCKWKDDLVIRPLHIQKRWVSIGSLIAFRGATCNFRVGFFYIVCVRRGHKLFCSLVAIDKAFALLFWESVCSFCKNHFLHWFVGFIDCRRHLWHSSCCFFQRCNSQSLWVPAELRWTGLVFIEIDWVVVWRRIESLALSLCKKIATDVLPKIEI